MAVTPLPFPDMILSAIVTSKPDIIRVKFGGGYSQRTARGFNHMEEDMSVQWIGLTKQQMQDLRLALSGPRAGLDLFAYATDASPTVKNWAVVDFTTGEKRVSNTWNVSARFKREYDIT